MRAMLLLLLLITPAYAARWPGVVYSDVRGYVYNRSRYAPLVEDGKLGSTVVNKAGVRLTAPQIHRLITAVRGKSSGSIDLHSCWSPHHGFVFYDARGKAVAWVEVCFKCSNIRSSPPNDGVYDMKALRKLANDLNLPDLPKKT